MLTLISVVVLASMPLALLGITIGIAITPIIKRHKDLN